ncbi:zinc-binding alcohol dehydrogenase family protein [Pseudomonas yamanorum]|uniref:quinone oxidoreductase family protein n=1 Tax=Pseudomonas yamanorum TaxID=515393 RepID=UPI0015A44C1F|nr:zinc-binding alcohol dehydrogenase family protein [Pseudomonas yamanorum]NWD23597.1 zinc-binding alcohol dehydrogenase family protein [Pseudomonas yamanorum]
MRAAVYDNAGPAEVLVYKEIPDPACGRNDVLIAVEAISIEGGDLINRRSSPVPRPSFVGGFMAAGRVIAIGANVINRSVGDRVTSFDLDGSHADLRAVPASRTWLTPRGIGMLEAAAVPVSFGTADHCLFTRGGLRPGETVLILGGSGGVGLAAIQLAKRAGAKVLAVTSGSKTTQDLIRLGADHVIDRLKVDTLQEVMRLTSSEKVDLVIDPIGSTLQASLAMLKPEGRLVFVGNAGGAKLDVDLWPALQGNQSLFGVFMGTQLELPSVHKRVEDILQAVANGELEVVINGTFRLADAVTAHQYAETTDALGRTFLVP